MVKEEVAEWRSVRPLTLNEVDSTSELRRRNTPNHALEEGSVWTLKVRTSTCFLTFLKLTFAVAAHHLSTTDTDSRRSANSKPTYPSSSTDNHGFQHIDSLDD
jgi:hypothetical protein